MDTVEQTTPLCIPSGYAVIELTGDSEAFSDYWRNGERVYFQGHYYTKCGDAKIAVLKKGAATDSAFRSELEDIENLFITHGLNVRIGDISSFFSKYKLNDRKSLNQFIQKYWSC